jgi:uncharacterized protein YegP (UPF0339 family)
MMLNAEMIESIKVPTSRLVLLKTHEGYNFELIGSNGEKWVTGNRFSSAVQCIRAMLSIKENAQNDNCFHKCISPDFRYYFVVTSPEGTLLASSDLYRTATGRNYAMARMQHELLFSEMVEE